VLSPKLALVSLGLLGVLVLGTVALAALGESWGNAAYEVVLDAAGAAQPDVTLSVVKKILQAVITITGITFIPVVTAAFVDAVVKARLATALGRPPRMRDHVVVVGLGNVGARVLMRLHYLGIPVIGVEVAEDARGVLTARRLGIPVVLGDATRDSTLRDAQVSTSRSLLGVTNNDVVNLEAGLHGQAMKAGLRVVLRLFDDDLAERVAQRVLPGRPGVRRRHGGPPDPGHHPRRPAGAADRGTTGRVAVGHGGAAGAGRRRAAHVAGHRGAAPRRRHPGAARPGGTPPRGGGPPGRRGHPGRAEPADLLVQPGPTGQTRRRHRLLRSWLVWLTIP
jgi:hypothetical protein